MNSFLRPGTLLRVAAIAAPLVLTASGFSALAATPATGTLSPTVQQLDYTGTDPVGTGNPSDTNRDGTTLTCSPVLTCDDYALHVDLPGDYAITNPGAKIRVTLNFPDDGSDWDLYVADSGGNYGTRYSVHTAPPASETLEFPAGAGLQDFKVRAVPSQPISGDYSASIQLVPGSILTPPPSASALDARFVTSHGWVHPNESYFFKVKYDARGKVSATLTVQLPPSAFLVSSAPAPTSSAAHSASYNVAGQSGQVVVTARAASLTEDPEVVWKNISATAQLVADGVTSNSTTNGPRVTELESAIFGDRPFPVINVQYADIGHCTAANSPTPDCVAAHPVAALDALLNSRTSGHSIWQHYTDMSLGQLNPEGTVAAAGTTTVAYTGIGQFKFARLAPSGACTGTTRAGPGTDGAGTGGLDGSPSYANRIEGGWYTLPGTENFYGADKYGHGAVSALSGEGVVSGIDDACGPTGKLAYDAASIADPDVDYNDFDTDRDGIVDFFEVIFAGVGGNGNFGAVTSTNNIWPHSSNLEFYFTDVNGEKGYVSNDQRRDAQERPLWWTNSSRIAVTTTDMGNALKAHVRVGRYNVNPETALDKSSVVSHEYGHSLGWPDFYSFGSRTTFGTWDLMAEDHSQFTTGYDRSYLGWIVPQTLDSGSVTLRESKFDTHSIKWRQPDGTPYELSGSDVHNADLFRVKMPNTPLIADVPDGTHAAHSGAGNDFGCAPNGGHGLVVSVPDMAQQTDATAATLKFKSKYEIEWDFDYGFVLASTDGGNTWQSLPSKKGTTISGYNPNSNSCYSTWGNGITGSSASANTTTSPDRINGAYPTPTWIDDEYDLTAFKGQSLLLALSYSTDPGLAKKGWFVDSLSVSATKASGTQVLYQTSFEDSDREEDDIRLGSLGLAGWRRLSTDDGGTADHAYYIELRDRSSWDFNGKNQDDRANGPDWQPGVSMIYTRVAAGYGNTDGVDPPNQTPVDANPEPGNESPDLSDASFNLVRPDFDGCKHVDNYTDPGAADGLWHMPASLKFTVTSITGLSTDGSVPGSPATATLVAELNPDCNIELVPPDLAIGSDYVNPDGDGAYTLGWNHPTGAVGPDVLQEATVLQTVIDDPAANLNNWVAAGGSQPSPMWTTSTAKPNHVDSAFWADPVSEQQTQNKSATLTYKNPITIPAGYSSELSFKEWYFNEDDDRGYVEVSVDDGTTWAPIYTNARPMGNLPDTGANAYSGEDLTTTRVDLSGFAGQTIRLRFRYTLGPSNFVFFVEYGWYIDDVKLTLDNFHDILTTPDTTAPLTGRSSGNYYYRVRTRYPAGPTATVASLWSNVVPVVVNVAKPPVAKAGDDFNVTEGANGTLTGESSFDPNGDALTFSWSQVSGPAVTVTNGDRETASFTAPTVCTNTPVVFRLTVTDPGGLSSTDDVQAIVRNINSPPVASAGSDFTVTEGHGAMLSAAGTADSDCEALSYAWSQISGPVVTLANADTASPSFTAPMVDGDSVARFRVRVTDPAGATSSDDVEVTVLNGPPNIGNNAVGALSPLGLIVLSGLGAFRRRRRRI